MNIEFIDIKRAYLQAEIRREVYIELPPRGQAGRDVCRADQGNVRDQGRGTVGRQRTGRFTRNGDSG